MRRSAIKAGPHCDRIALPAAGVAVGVIVIGEIGIGGHYAYVSMRIAADDDNVAGPAIGEGIGPPALGLQVIGENLDVDLVDVEASLS